MIHNVLIVFGQEKASTQDISNLDSKFYLHGKKKNPVILGVVTMTVRRSASRGAFCTRERGFPYLHMGIITNVCCLFGHSPGNYSQYSNLTGLIQRN